MTEKRKLQFQIEAVTPMHENQFAIEGRCCADSIHINDTFTRSYEQLWNKGADGFSHLSFLEPGIKVTIKVVKIRSIFVRGSLETVEAGTLIVETDNSEAICHNRMLIGDGEM